MNVLVTGAGSGIGKAIALECARRGDRLFLCGRDAGRLEESVAACRALGASAEGRILDVRDESAVRGWIFSCDAAAPLDMVFANAGVAAGEETEENVRTVFAVNVAGCANTVLPAVAAFRRRRASSPAAAPRTMHILATASIAGYAPLAGCPSYSASKSFVKTWALALRGALAGEGIRVTAVCPGFVRSRITDANRFRMPFFMEADRAARIILSRARRNPAIIAFPWQMRLAAWFMSVLPAGFAGAIGRLLPSKGSGAADGRKR